MKNYFGLVPGSIYGWPKNELHFIGIDTAIVELTRAFGPKSFALVDGIVGMEGNGPIQGTRKQAGVLVMGSDLAAVDATCCRIMRIDPTRIRYLQLATGPYASAITEDNISQIGETIQSVGTPFDAETSPRDTKRGSVDSQKPVGREPIPASAGRARGR